MTTASLALLGLTGCAALAPQETSLMSRDLYDIKQQLAEQRRLQEALDNKLTFALTQIDQNVQSQTSIMQGSISGMEGMIRDQQQQMERLNQQFQAVSVTIESLARRGGINGGAVQPPGPARSGGAAEQAYQTALAQSQQGQHDQARESLRQALELNPSQATRIDILYLLGLTMMELRELDSAEGHFRELITLDSADPKAWASFERIAQIKRTQGDNATALQILRAIDEQYREQPTAAQFGLINIEQVRARIQEIEAGSAGAAAPPRPTL